jgi:hypothetical protein
MNETPPEKPRRRGRGRAAGATAAVLGAALLAYPGTASAQADIDCAALGDNPTPRRIGPALDIAIACDIEVRVSGSAWHHSTVAVTPAGQLHLVSTAEPVQEHDDDGAPDPVLADFAGSLSQSNANWSVFLQYTDQTYPLIETPAATFDWTGETPVPDYSGTTAVYDELAAGLDLAVDVGISTFDLRFTAVDAAAWDALATGLRAEGAYRPLLAADGALHVDHDIENEMDFLTEGTTPFIVRDAQGATHRAGVAVAEDGALTVDLPDQTLAEAAFPLTLTTQWASRSGMVNEWGAVTSASPDLPLYRGEAGLDEPYFAAAGQGADLVAGAYCDAAGGSACVDAEAVAYWNFGSSVNLVRDPAAGYEFDYPVTSAVFRVEAAEGADCAAPDLDLAEEYSTAVTWNDRPAATGFAASGSCQAGAAVYDLTDPVADAWSDFATAEPITLSTAATAPTARFDGGSARLDVYFDIAGINTNAWCSNEPTVPDFYSHQVDADLYVEAWRDDVYDLGLAWTATVKDPATGETVLTTGPEPVPSGGATVGTIEAGLLPQGAYVIDYQIASGTAGLLYTAPPCHVVVDTATPSPDYAVEPGPHRIGDTVSVEVTLGAQEFAAESDQIYVRLYKTTEFDPVDSVRLTEAGTAVLEVALTDALTQLRLEVEDRAGHEFYTWDGLAVAAALDHRDYNGDGLEDLMAVRKSDGALMFAAGKGDGTFAAGVAKGTGWGGLDVTMAGDLTADGNADLLARDATTGTLYTYPGDGSGGVGARITVGTGWNAMGAFTAAGDFDTDGDIDMYAVSNADGTLYLYSGQGNGSGRFNPRVAVGTGWGAMDALASVGDLNGDGKPDLLAHDSRTGEYHLYRGNGAGGLGNRVTIPASLDGSGSDRYNQIAAAGDQDGDGRNDLLAVDSRTGELELHSLYSTGSAVHAGRVVASSWGGNRLAAVNEARTYDYNGDGASDFVARRNTDGTTFLYPGTGGGTHGTRVSWGTALNGMTLIATAGDLNGDGFADVLARTSGGTLYVYPGAGSGALDTAGRITIGSGWNSMSAIAGGHDHDSDGKADVIAVGTDGTLWLYPGTGSGTLGSRTSIGSGWTSMKEVTPVGDLDHDGHADMIAVKNSDGCLYFYGGKGDGFFKSRVQIGCGWGGYDALTAVGDFNGGGHGDWLARRQSDGNLFAYFGDGAGSAASRSQIGTAWNSMTIA